MGLLDSGAQLSCIGGNLARDLCEGNELRHYRTFIRTADGREQVAFANFNTEVKFRDRSNSINFYVVPSLSQSIILGVDFWKVFGIAPDIISEIERDQDLSVVDYERHDMTPGQRLQLESVKALFPSYETDGLGKTSLMKHEIELEPNSRPMKQRYFPISPAIERIVHNEIDEMLRLGVIEETPPNSPWSSPVVLVRKSEKVRLC